MKRLLVASGTGDPLVFLHGASVNAHDPTLIERLRVPELCPMGPEGLEAIERRFEDLEAHRHSQKRPTEDGARTPNVSRVAMQKLAVGFETPDELEAAMDEWLEDLGARR